MSDDAAILIQSLYRGQNGRRKAKLAKSGADNINQSIIREGFNCLGRHPLLLKHTYLELRIPDKNINSISMLRDYPWLMYVDISQNSIVNLEDLEHLPTLVQLNASYNLIEKCLNFAPPKCTPQNAWSTGKDAIGSMLVRANLSYNKITALQDLSHHPFLECLMLSHNEISTISGLENLRYLQTLDLSYNNITQITGLDELPLQELNLQGNALTDIEGFTNLPYLSCLNIAENQVSCLGPLESCVQLHYLDVRANKISQIRQVEFLQELRWLRTLLMTDNEASRKPFYRLRVVLMLPSLTQLDLVHISAEEKIQAMNLYGVPGSDRDLRAEVFAKYFPDETFVDYSPNFIDDEAEMTLEELSEQGRAPVTIPASTVVEMDTPVVVEEAPVEESSSNNDDMIGDINDEGNDFDENYYEQTVDEN